MKNMKVVVIGGGPAGMMAAITSAKQGIFKSSILSLNSLSGSFTIKHALVS